MDEKMSDFLERRRIDNLRIREESPNLARGFGGLFQAVMKQGQLSVREKELIAFAIALALRCTPCINLHIEKCLKAGATKDEIIEAAGVAVVMQGGPAFTHIPEVIEAIDALQETAGV